MQRERFAKHATVGTHSAMTPRLLKKHYELDADSLAMLENVMTEHGFSARANNHILKLAHTIADLDSF